jgi:hypothetical protein
MATSFSPLESKISSQFEIKGSSSVTDGLSGSFELLFTISIVFAVIVGAFSLAYAGGLRVGVDGFSSSKISKSNDIFRRVFLVLIIILPLTLFLKIINPDFLRTDISLRELRANKVNIDEQSEHSNPSTQDQKTPESKQGNSQPGVENVVGGADSIYRNKLLSSGIKINPNVNFEGINPSSVDLLVNLKSACPKCNIIVTSAVRTGNLNSNHLPGKGAIDLGIDQNIISFLKSNGTPVSAGGCQEKDKWGGYIFWYEWNISTNTKCSAGATGPHYHVSPNGW